MNENRIPGYFDCASAAAFTRFCTSAADCPLSMSKSTPIMCGVAYRAMKLCSAVPEHLNDPAAPPVLTM
ncbi:hypothetical protein [Curtobacterium sp. B18]|uniref:hypothetical protein n=1 Tax=Curtobacterium sp. B18 TaxID=95614 RepID=UPI0016510534|nr:hypothetical protein [Curtobacterium sp. B18]